MKQVSASEHAVRTLALIIPRLIADRRMWHGAPIYLYKGTWGYFVHSTNPWPNKFSNLVSPDPIPEEWDACMAFCKAALEKELETGRAFSGFTDPQGYFHNF